MITIRAKRQIASRKALGLSTINMHSSMCISIFMRYVGFRRLYNVHSSLLRMSPLSISQNPLSLLGQRAVRTDGAASPEQ